MHMYILLANYYAYEICIYLTNYYAYVYIAGQLLCICIYLANYYAYVYIWPIIMHMYIFLANYYAYVYIAGQKPENKFVHLKLIHISKALFYRFVF